MPIRILSGADVRAALPMPLAIAAMRRAFGQLSAGQAEMPLRTRVATPGGVTLLMPAYLRGSGDFAVKIVSVFAGNAARGLPVVPASVLVLDPATGLLKALMDGTTLTALRTGAGGGLAADLLARPEARVVGLIGAGQQARAQLQGVLAVRAITQVNVFSRTLASAQRLAEEVRGWPGPPEVTVVASPRAAVQAADIVLAATTSATPVLDGRDLSPGAHVTGVGSYTPAMCEVDAVTIQRAAKIVVDAREACAAEAGELIAAQASIYAELGELVNGVKPGRESADEITFFKSVGVAAQDAAAAATVLAEAEARGLGTLVDG